MKISKIPLAQNVVQQCKTHQIKHIVISPGSRNAPLTISFTNDDFFECYSIVDERCAAFFALGIAQQIKYPVAVVCTSGSALLNYYPAISEAYYSRIPLVVLSADRPEYKVDIGDGQTIKQPNVYGEHSLCNVNLKQDINDDEPFKKDDIPLLKILKKQPSRFKELKNNIEAFNISEINTALKISIEKSGPVHINVPFEEPLYETIDLDVEVEELSFSNGLKSTFKIENEDQNIWSSSKKKMILVGVLSPNSIETEIINQLAKDDSVIVFTETTSNLHHPDFFNSIDTIIAPLEEEDFINLQPDLLLTIGGMIVSKKIKAFLRKHQPKNHWHVGKHVANDTFYCLSKHFDIDVSEFFDALDLSQNNDTNTYKSYWLNIKNHRLKKHNDYLKNIPFCDFLVFDKVLKSIPKNHQLQVGNSSAIRYTQLFELNPTIHVFCNRGTSGIDGSTSTAIGASTVSKNPVIFITGDLSFFYDSNALWNNYIPKNFRIILINNSGGGIFRILPGHKDTENFDTYFETKHQLTAEQLCEMFGFDYHTSKNEIELKQRLSDFFDDSNQPKLLEIFTPSTINDKILLEYFDFVK